MTSSVFIFDVVIKCIDIEECKVQSVQDLVVVVESNNFSLNIRSDRSLALDFHAGGSYEFEAFPELLTLEMQLFPINIRILYQNSEIGFCKVKWPEHLIDKVDESMKDILHCTKCQIESAHGSVGTIEMLLRLRIKPRFPSVRIKDFKKDQDLENMLEKGDTFFVLSEREKQGSHSDSNDINIKEWSTPSILTECPLHKIGSGSNFKAKPFNSSSKCETNNNKVIKIVDCNGIKTIRNCKTKSDTCFDIKKPSSKFDGTGEVLKAASENVLPEASDINPRFVNSNPVSRCCPTCKADISWLPDVIPCPTCGGYVSEYGKKPPYNTNLTAEGVLNMFAATCKDESTDDCPENYEQESYCEKKKKKFKSKCKHMKRKALNRRCSRTKKHCHARLTAYIKALLPAQEGKHFKCQHGYKPVPPHMGWMWNLMATGKYRNWRPGSIRKPIRELMSWFLTDFPADTIPISKYAGCKRNEINKQSAICQEKLIQEPTLHILKRKAEYVVTMRPLKDNSDLQNAVNPYLEMKPVQLKIVKNPVLLAIRKIKRKIKDFGFSSCTCGRPVTKCFCHNYKDQTEINRIVDDECWEHDLPICKDTFVFSDITESESEIDFAVTPPIGRLKLDRLNKSDKTDVGTQYDINDWKLAPRLLINSALMRLCRKTKKNQLKEICHLSKCPQNIQPPIIIPKIEKPPKLPKKSMSNKRGKAAKSRKK